MPPLTQAQLIETLTAFFGWADFSCPNLPKVQSYFCHDKIPGITFTEPSMAKQAFKEEADINNIVNQYNRTGILPQGTREPIYGDFSDGDDFNSALIKLQEAKEDFNSLPSHIRESFDNDPAELLNFISDPENREEAIELGLVAAPPEPPKEEPVTAPVPPVTEPPTS